MPAQHVFHERKALVSDGGACLLNNVLQYPFFAPGDVKETATEMGYKTEPHVVVTSEIIENMLEEFEILVVASDDPEGAEKRGADVLLLLRAQAAVLAVLARRRAGGAPGRARAPPRWRAADGEREQPCRGSCRRRAGWLR